PVPIRTQVFPFLIDRPDQCNLLVPKPALDLFFPSYRCFNIVGLLEINKLCNVVLEGKTGNELLFMLVDPPHDIVGYSYIQSAGVVCHYVDVVTILLHDLTERSFAPLRMTFKICNRTSAHPTDNTQSFLFHRIKYSSLDGLTFLRSLPNPQLLLRFSEDRKIGYIALRNFASHLGLLFRLLDEKTES